MLYLKPQDFVFYHLMLDQDDASHISVNDCNIRSHFKYLTKTLLESFTDYMVIDPNYTRLVKPWNEKEFLKGINSKNRFCREFMGGHVDKCQKFYRGFV